MILELPQNRTYSHINRGEAMVREATAMKRIAGTGDGRGRTTTVGTMRVVSEAVFR